MDCPHCDGTGVDPDDEDGTKPCPECDGTGFVDDEDEEEEVEDDE